MAIAILIGRQQPSVPLLFSGLVTCQGIPCYEGIELLKTSRSNARAILQQLPDAAWDDTTNRMSFSSGSIDWVELAVDSKDKVFRITLHLRPGAVSLGAIINSWGIPCGIESIGAENTHSGYNDAQIYYEGDYPNNAIWIPASGGRVNPSTSVTGIDLNPRAGEIVDGYRVTDSCALFSRPPWKGFKNYAGQ